MEHDDEVTLEEEERRAREEAAHADGDGPMNELDQLQADGELPLDELLRRYGYVTNQNNDDDEDDGQSSEVDSEVPSSSAVSGTTAGAQGSSVAASESEKEQRGAGLGSAGNGNGNGNGGEQGKLDSGSDDGRGEQEGGDSSQEKKDQGDGGASDDADDALRRLEAADVAARALRVPRPFMLAKSLRLREYQHAGLSWLVSLHERRLNGILADEMGLGKTVQTISLLAYLACHKGLWGPHLIVVPTSCIVNWETELKRFLPGFKVLTYYGNAKQRKELRTGWTKLNAFHVCITSYQLAVQDASSFKRKKWYHLILDEAQNIKNFKSQRWQTLLTFNSQRRLLLTGTPLQNSLMELWSLMHFLMPHVFRSRKEFSYWFSQPLTHMVEGSRERNDDLIRRLHSVVRPFLLRRLKRDVEKQLPGKHEHVLMCKLSRRQAALYEEFMSRSSTRAALQGGNFMGMMNILMQLRKVCNHPDLFEARQIDSPFVLPALELSVGTQILRSPLRFPVGVGGVTSAWAVWGGGGGGGARALSTSGENGVSGDFAGVVSPRLIAPLWAHDLTVELTGLDSIATEYLSKWCTPAEVIIRAASKLPLPVPDPAQELQDLLADSSLKGKVVLREDTKRGVVCCGLEEVQVLTAKDIFSILSKGIQQRKTAETLMNKNSSRSHSIFTLKIMIKEWMPDGQEVMRNGQLNLVDLAGSECVGRSGATNARAREAGNINQSLLTLGRVITALVEHHPHVPYRDSKLTRLLQESLGGRAKTCIIATVTASSDALEETLSSLDYALKAKSIQNKPVANQKLSKTHLLKEYAGEVESLRSMLQASRDKNGVYVEPWRFEQMENTLASQSNQITEMEGILMSRNAETKELKAQRDAFQERATELEGELEVSRAKEEATKAKLVRTREILKGVEEDLAASRAKSEALSKRLAATLHELDMTKDELGATRAMVAEQALTEAKLRSEAGQTKRSLALAESDVAGLRAKIARQEDEAADKRSRAKEFGQKAVEAAAEVSDAVARFTGAHGQGCEGLRQGLAEAEQAARSAARGLSVAAVSALEEVNRHCKEMAMGVADGAASTRTLLLEASTGLEKALSLQKSALKEWEGQMADSLSQLRQELEGHETDLNSLSEDVRRRSEEAERGMADFKDKCAIELAAVRSWAEETVAAQAKQMELNNEAALSLAAKSRADAKQDAAELMQTVAGLLSAMETRASSRADKQADVAGEAWAESISTSKSFGVAVSDKMDAVGEIVSSGSQHMLQKLAESFSATNSTIEGQAKSAAAFAKSTVGLAESVAAGTARSSTLGDATSTSLKESLSVASEAVGDAANACDRSSRDLVQENKRRAESVAALTAATDQRTEETMRKAEKQVSGLASAVGDMAASHASSVGKCVEQIEAHVEKVCAKRDASGGTPERKRYPRPERYSITRSHSDIVSDYRAGRIVTGLDAVSDVTVHGETDVAIPIGAGDSDHENKDEEYGRQSSSGVVSSEIGAYSALGLGVDSELAESIPTNAVGVEDGGSEDSGPTDDNEKEEEMATTTETTSMDGEENMSVAGSPRNAPRLVKGNSVTEGEEAGGGVAGGGSPLSEATNTSGSAGNGNTSNVGNNGAKGSKIPVARRSTRARSRVV